MKALLGSGQSGQVIVEYIIMLSIAITLVLLIQGALTRSASRLWLQFSCEVAAPCPTCRGVDQNLKNRASQAGVFCGQ